MKIIHLSDTNGQHELIKDLPESDIIIHSGDITFTGSENEVIAFLEWFIEFTIDNTTYVNTSILNEKYVLSNKPIILEL